MGREACNLRLLGVILQLPMAAWHLVKPPKLKEQRPQRCRWPDHHCWCRLCFLAPFLPHHGTQIWFFTPNNEKGSRRAFWPAVYNVLRFHLGSCAFGAFIIAVIQLIRPIY